MVHAERRSCFPPLRVRMAERAETESEKPLTFPKIVKTNYRHIVKGFAGGYTVFISAPVRGA